MEYFSINRKGLHFKTCDKCRERGRKYHESHKDQSNAYYEANKEKKKAWGKIYYEVNKERINAMCKVYRESHKDKIKVYKKAYQEVNKDKIKSRKKIYVDNKRHHCEHNTQKQRCKICDPNGHLKSIVSGRVRQALKSSKSKRSIEYLGCDIETFRQHISDKFTEGMSWANHGEWEIDHCIPIKYKQDGVEPTLEEVALRLHYTNTQPLWKKDNRSKGNRCITGLDN